MRTILITLVVCLPMVMSAQSTLTPEQQLEQAQLQLAKAQAELKQAQENVVKARLNAKAKTKQTQQEETKNKTLAIKKKIEETKAEADRLNTEAARLKQESVKSLKNSQERNIVESSEEETIAPTPNTWSVPTKNNVEDRATTVPNNEVNNKTYYLQEGIVPFVNNEVIWSQKFDAPGKSAKELYGKAFEYLTKITQGKNQLEGSQISLVNPERHGIVASMKEYLIFSSNFFSVDRAKFTYILQVSCSDGQAELIMKRLNYAYEVSGSVTNYKAEEMITDKYAINKKRTRLLPIAGKFRRTTIDRKNEIFEGFATALK